MKKIPNPFLRTFIDVAPAMMNAEMRADRCLNATRVLIDVMHAFKVSAFPVSVKVLAINDVFFTGIRKLGRWPENDEEGRMVMANGGYSIGVDTRQTAEDNARGKWAGHLCAIVQDFLVDPSAGQMSRPQHRIVIPEMLVAPSSKRFLKGKSACIELSLEHNARLFYWARADDRSYERVSGFQQHDWNVSLAARIANEIAKRLNRPPVYMRVDELGNPMPEDDEVAAHECEDENHVHGEACAS